MHEQVGMGSQPFQAGVYAWSKSKCVFSMFCQFLVVGSDRFSLSSVSPGHILLYTMSFINLSSGSPTRQ